AGVQRRRRPAYFGAHLEPGALGVGLKRAGNEWLDADSPAGTAEDLAETIQEVRRLQPAAVVVDAPAGQEDYLQALRQTRAMVVSIDSQAGIPFPAPPVVNPPLAPRP